MIRIFTNGERLRRESWVSGAFVTIREIRGLKIAAAMRMEDGGLASWFFSSRERLEARVGGIPCGGVLGLVEAETERASDQFAPRVWVKAKRDGYRAIR